MSVKVMAFVWDLPLAPQEKFVALALADFAAPDGTHIFPTAEMLAKKTSYDERSVRRVVATLKTIGLIKVVGKRGRTPELLIDMDWIPGDDCGQNARNIADKMPGISDDIADKNDTNCGQNARNIADKSCIFPDPLLTNDPSLESVMNRQTRAEKNDGAEKNGNAPILDKRNATAIFIDGHRSRYPDDEDPDLRGRFVKRLSVMMQELGRDRYTRAVAEYFSSEDPWAVDHGHDAETFVGTPIDRWRNGKNRNGQSRASPEPARRVSKYQPNSHLYPH